MKITFITRENSEMPAVRVRCHGFANNLKKLGIETEVFSYADKLGAKSGKEEKLMSSFDKTSYNLRAFKYLLKNKSVLFLQRFNYHAFAPLAVNFLKGRKMIFDLDDWEARENIDYYFGCIPSSKAELFMRFIAKKSNFCIGASKFLVDFLSRHNKKVFYIPTGVDTDVFKPAVGENKQNNSIVLSWIGTMHRMDNVENLRFLLECFNELSNDFSDIILEIAGDGIYRQNVVDLVSLTRNNRIKLKGWIKPEEVPEYLNKIDIGVMPLIQDTKFNKAKSPTRLFEYMAVGKPTISSYIGEAKYVIQDGRNGFLAGSKKEFIAKLGNLIKDAVLRSALGKEAREKASRQYSLKLLTNRLAEAIKLL